MGGLGAGLTRGLISDALDTQLAGVCHADMPQGDPRLVRCPVCFSRAGEPCTQPTDNGQRRVAWYHLMREDNARATCARCGHDLDAHAGDKDCMCGGCMWFER